MLEREKVKLRIKKSHLECIGLALVVVLAAVLLWYKATSSNQSSIAILPDIRMEGEYKIGDGEWKKIREGEHISATRGDVTLRGHLMIIYPGEEEIIEPVANGTSFAVYCNHIDVSYKVPGMEDYTSDIENPIFGEYACGSVWNVCEYEGTDTDTMEFVIHNPHKFGNENAIDELLESLSVYGNKESNIFQNKISKQSAPERIFGIVYVILSLILLGVALFSSMIQIPYSRNMWLIGFMFLFAGLFFGMDTLEMSLFRSFVVIKTTARELGMMIYMLCLCALCTTLLTDKRKQIGGAATYVLGGVTIAMFLTSLFGHVSLYDMNQFWGMVLTIINLILIGCLAVEIFHTDGKKVLLPGGGIFALLVAIADYVAVYGGFYATGLFSKVVFLFLSFVAMVVVLNVIPRNIRAAMREKELKEELQETRIMTMLSQIQPHYLFNSLSTIKHLCRKDPQEAMNTIDHFSHFLRGSMKVLKETGKITFEQEIRFVESYLYLEKKRFGDKLQVEFDLKASGFLLPALCVQTIVENAVRHGIARKLDGGTVRIVSDEDENSFLVSVIDDGKGFDTDILSGEMKDHIGISNTRVRLSRMCGGWMEISSQPGEGTRVDIHIPKNERKC